MEPAAYARLLGYPRERLPEGRVGRLADDSRAWFRERASPWASARTLAVSKLGDDVELDGGTVLGSSTLAGRLRRAGSNSLAIAVVSAGAEIDLQSAGWWESDRPDEAYFLDRLGAAAVRQLARWAADALREQASHSGLDVLPGYSPGFEGWALTDQQPLADCLDRSSTPAGFEVLSSGMMRPKNSLLAVFGITGRRDLAASAWNRHRCSWCSLADCRIRRGAFQPARLGT